MWLEKYRNEFKQIKYPTFFLYHVATTGLTQNWLQVAINDISIQKFSNVMPQYNSHYVVSIFELFTPLNLYASII